MSKGVSNGVGNHEGEEEAVGGMYAMPRPYELPADVQLPKSMYAVAPINKTPSSSEAASVSNSTHDVLGGRCISRGTLTKNSKSSGAQSDDAMNSLERKQLKIIEQLKSLQNVITNIHQKSFSKSETIVGSSHEVAPACSEGKQLLTKENIDVVIHANPNEAPFSLMFFANLFEQHYENAVVSIKSHIHSSYKGTVNMDALSVFNQEKDGANFRFTVIWKNVDTCTLIITPIESTYIIGEANMARFLSRLLPTTNASLNYDCLNWERLVRVDSLLDVAHEENVVSLVEKELKNTNNNFLTGQPTIADLVIYSSVASKVVASKGEKNAPASVKNWFKQLEIAFGFYNSMN